MDNQVLLVVMTIFVAVAAIALVIMVGLLVGIYKSARQVEDQAKRLMPKIEGLVDSSRTVVEQSRTQISEITSRTTEILDVTKRQLARIDDVLEDATARAHVQLDRAEMVLDDTLTRAHQTVAVVHGGIMKPLREIQGVAAGLRTALSYLMRSARPNPSEVAADEEMFI